MGSTRPCFNNFESHSNATRYHWLCIYMEGASHACMHLRKWSTNLSVAANLMELLPKWPLPYRTPHVLNVLLPISFPSVSFISLLSFLALPQWLPSGILACVTWQAALCATGNACQHHTYVHTCQLVSYGTGEPIRPTPIHSMAACPWALQSHLLHVYVNISECM